MISIFVAHLVLISSRNLHFVDHATSPQLLYNFFSKKLERHKNSRKIKAEGFQKEFLIHFTCALLSFVSCHTLIWPLGRFRALFLRIYDSIDMIQNQTLPRKYHGPRPMWFHTVYSIIWAFPWLCGQTL